MFQNVADESARAKTSTPQTVRKMPNRKSIQTDQVSQDFTGVVRVPVPIPVSCLTGLHNFKNYFRKITKRKKLHPKSFHRHRNQYTMISTLKSRPHEKVPMITWVSPNELYDSLCHYNNLAVAQNWDRSWGFNQLADTAGDRLKCMKANHTKTST